LKAMGRLKPPGIARPPGAKGSAPKPKRVELPAKLPSYIQAALRKNSTARKNYDALSPAHQRQYFAWIDSAKREETRRKRLEGAIRMLARGEELGLK
ncbi:MAG TPA: YdeI/OmpD-associated family protein, partial [Gemmatimonadales bacterium]|nr:YdeI/OmpD-associated family protein [Gemmatimonadales bacterium]